MLQAFSGSPWRQDLQRQQHRRQLCSPSVPALLRRSLGLAAPARKLQEPRFPLQFRGFLAHRVEQLLLAVF